MRKPGWLLSPSFCLDAISLSFIIFIHSLLFCFISQLILFIICPYLRAWQSILHSASVGRWKNDPCLTLPSITSLLPSLLSSWSPSETRLTACYISSSHSNPPILTSSWQSFFSTEHALSLACSMSLTCNNWGWDKREGTFSKTTEGSKESEWSPSLQPLHSPAPQIYLPLSGCIFLQTLYDTFIYPCSSRPHPHYIARITWRLHADTGHSCVSCISRTAWRLLCSPHAWRQIQSSKQRYQSTQHRNFHPHLIIYPALSAAGKSPVVVA